MDASPYQKMTTIRKKSLDDDKQIYVSVVAMAIAAIFICLKITVLPEAVNRVLKILCIVVILGVKGIPILLKYRRLVFVLIDALAISFTTFVAGADVDNLSYAIISGLGACALFAGFYDQVEAHGRENVATTTFWTFFCFSIVNDVSILLSHSHTSGEAYLLGSKFIASYLHIVLLALYLYLISKKSGTILYNKILYVLFLLESAFILKLADTMTGVLALGMFFVFSLLPKKFAARFSVGWMLVVVIIVANLIFFATDMLLDNPAVANFVQNMLNRPLNLNGRTQIYSVLGDLILQRPLTGYGYGNNLIIAYVGWGNAQNGIGELLINFGLVGTMSFFAMLIAVLPHQSQDVDCARSLACGALAFVLAALVEITFGTVFTLFLALFSALSTVPEQTT